MRGGHASCRLRATSRRWAARRCCRGCSDSSATWASRRCSAPALLRRLLRGPADRQLLPAPAGGGRAQCRLRADVAAHQAGAKASDGAFRFLLRRIRRHGCSPSSRSQSIGLVLAPGRDRACSRRASTASATPWRRTICTSPRPMSRSPASSRSLPRRSMRRARRRGRDRHRGVQRRPAGGPGVDRRRRAAGRDHSRAGACSSSADRACRDWRSLIVDRRVLRLPLAADTVAAHSAVQRTRAASSRSPCRAWSRPASRS